MLHLAQAQKSAVSTKDSKGKCSIWGRAQKSVISNKDSKGKCSIWSRAPIPKLSNPTGSKKQRKP